jgi:tRNA threonylcarbamoyladenosine biosynthesis protein TsaB
MNILAFETCLGACSVAVGLDAGGALEKVEALYEEMATGHAERLMPMIDTAMRTAGIGFADLNRIAVTTGPGTFTGTRIGIAAARAFALATATSIIGISTLQLMAEEAGHALNSSRRGRAVAVTVDAHRGQVYAQVFAAGGSPEPPPQLLTIKQAAALAADRELIFVGSGAAIVAAAAKDAGHVAEAALPNLQPNAAFLLLAAQKCEPQEGPLRPLYLRPADAKPQVGKSLARAGA